MFAWRWIGFWVLCYVIFVCAALADDPSRSVWLDESRLLELREEVNQNIEPTLSAWRVLQRDADSALEREPQAPERWYVPGFYRDAEGHRSAKNVLQNDANDAFKLALAFRMTDERRYAQVAARLIRAWPATVEEISLEDDSTLSFSYHFPAMIFAADLLRGAPDWTDEDEEAFISFLRDKALALNTMNRSNNWGNWGLTLVMAAAVYLEDEALFNEGIERWKYFIAHQIDEDGSLPHEIHRNEGQRGLWYTHFTLFPQTIAAEIARVNGVDLYDYVAPNGRSLRQAFETVAPWSLHLDTFPFLADPNAGHIANPRYISYFEILNARWPNEAATRLLEELRPLDASHSAPVMTFTHGSANPVKTDR